MVGLFNLIIHILGSGLQSICNRPHPTKVKKWLELYGELLNDITEECHYEADPDAQKIGNGIYTVKMKIKKPIPNFLPCLGLKYVFATRDVICSAHTVIGKILWNFPLLKPKDSFHRS